MCKSKDLLAAVIQQAVFDITGPKGVKVELRPNLRRVALTWVESKREDFSSFAGICVSLELDPDVVRKSILSLPRKTIA